MSSGNTSSASLPAWVSPAGTRRSRFYVTSIVLVVSALVLCGAIIIYSNRPALGDDAMGAGAFVLTAAHLLMPYLFSAVVAAITALAILALLPLGRMDRPILQIQDRLQHLAAGDLSSKIRANPSHPQLTELAAELNHSIGALGEQIARW
ncbi:MAG TPA: hypothetical protein VN285_04770, partial [Candidatus Deferrimicrobium sp.]|nr:hypothetical protein [Candidatus Deferrimicrobium sp.]